MLTDGRLGMLTVQTANLRSIKKLEQVDDISFREQSVVFTKED
jgi:hypothetical protein